MHCQLRWIVASMMVLDSKGIADAMVCASRTLLRDLSRVNPPILYSLFIGTGASDKYRVSTRAWLTARCLCTMTLV